ncbi:nucleotide-diphospho-sugar transferase [Zychaea mexicana]|uniref:nucleotide-diphospho-sugar transferase n=1 Tax=Zychaea mexicana TaxID=64656 RepID=UPI0022FE5223|nr:nucleotide-diphospho-sugar transferase [Zychaea mexicana]KAI9491557.1 nucleotide-diphospho-sugar transferase [Zychaea mexicana]
MVSKTLPNAAWMLVLTNTNDYVKGAIIVACVLRRLSTQYPLVVLCTSAVSEGAQELLSKAGCILKRIEPIHPPGKTTYFAERFVETWTKLAVWNQDEYERVVLLDADMLPLQNMDELMTVPLPDGDYVAASHACTCNPQKIKAYPADWIPSNCAYTSSSASKNDYFNSGLIVLTPSQGKFQDIVARLYGVPDLSIYPFPDQDFLNEIFAGRWVPLPYIYNSLKTLSYAHSGMWNLQDVKNIHYILTPKPWEVNVKQEQEADESDQRYYLQYQLWWDLYNDIGFDTDTVNKALYNDDR